MTSKLAFLRQAVLATALIVAPVAAFTGYEVYFTKSVQAATGLGDLTQFKTIIADAQALVDKGDISAAAKRITDYETAWDQAETAIRPLDQTEWGNIDQASDGALSAVRKGKPDESAAKAALAVLMTTLNDPSKTPQ